MDINKTENFPVTHFAGRTLIVLGAFAIAASAAINNSKWWNENAGFKNKSWVFSVITILIVLLIIILIYLFVWYRCLVNHQSYKLNMLFILTAILFFTTFISVFLNRDPNTGFILGIVTLVLLIYLMIYVWRIYGTWYGVLMLIVTVFMIHFLAEIDALKF